MTTETPAALPASESANAGAFARGSAPALRRQVGIFAAFALALLWGGIAVLAIGVGKASDGSGLFGLGALLTGLGGLAWRFVSRLLDAFEARDRDISRLALTDPMTGALNHAGFMEALRRDVLRSQRYKHEFSLMRIDIDFFKRINDGYGHATGDAVIVSLADTVIATLRNVDALGRVGGASFAIGLPETPLDATEQLAERIRERIAGIEIATNREDHVRFSVSIGVAGISPVDSDAEQMLVRAEAALQRAKDKGRNRVETDRPEAAPV
jgi:diguanylate cyclase (GGDEF)-like protein